PNQMRGTRFYLLTALFLPALLTALARPSRRPWPATTIAALYMALVLVLIWVLQLVPAQPRLAPIFNPVTRMVPPPFPLLLVVPAVAVDLWTRRTRLGDWALATAIGVTWVALMAAAHWFWSEFLLSPAARGMLFGADRWDYNIAPGPWQYEYWTLERDAAGRWDAAAFARGLALAALAAAASARFGLWVGRGMTRVRR